MTDEEKDKLFEMLELMIEDLASISARHIGTHGLDLNTAKERKLLEQLKNPEPEDY
jgi:hypothetical protein